MRMATLPITAPELVFVRELTALELDDRALRREKAAGTLLALRRGVYVGAAAWSDLTSRERYRARIRATVGTRRTVHPVVCHVSAAVLWGFPILESWPRHVHLLVGAESPARSKNGVIVHRWDQQTAELTDLDQFHVTSPAQTLADLSRVLSFEESVAMIDHALNLRRALLPVAVTKEDVLACLARSPAGRGHTRAQRAISFADGLSGSVGESRSRVAIHQLGFPAPELQRRHPSLRSAYYETDFEWPEYRQIGEFDGAGKYLKEEWMGGRDTAQVVYEEKLREDELRAEGNGVTRWGGEELDDRSLLRAKLLAAGLPIVRPAPAPGAWGVVRG